MYFGYWKPTIRTTALIVFAVLPAAGCRHEPSNTPAAPANAPAPGIFRDVAKEAGLDFKWGHGGRSPLNIIETLGHGCAFLDYDQDGWQDILLVGNNRLALYRNLHNGKFEDVTAKAGLNAEGMFCGVAVGDYDNDGYPDLYVTGYGKCVLYHNTKHGSFEDVTKRAGLEARHPYDNVTAAAFVDLDGDGKLDLIAGRYILFTPKSIQFCTYHGVRAGCGVKNYDPDMPIVFRNMGADTFKDMTKPWGFDALHGRCLGISVRAADTGSGVELYIANDELAGNHMVRKAGRYVDIGVSSSTAYNRDGLPQGGMGVDWGDFNNDGRADLVVATFQNEPKSLYRNDGRNLYSEVGASLGVSADTTEYVAWTVKFFDYDNDGWTDLLITNGHSQDNADKIESARSYAQPLQLFHNEGGQLFRNLRSAAGESFAHPIVGRGAAFGDFDNDGKVDVLLVDEEGAAQLLHNEDRSGNHWLGVKLTGAKCNRDAIGARVTVTAGGTRLTRDLQLCGGYISSHDPRLHFGLGKASTIDKVEVGWPDGRKDTIRNVAPDRYVEIAEGKGFVSAGAGSPTATALAASRLRSSPSRQARSNSSGRS